MTDKIKKERKHINNDFCEEIKQQQQQYVQNSNGRAV
jgi:hypothetical protein